MSPEGDPGAQGSLPGAFIAVVGPSGAGKDTILSLSRERLGGESRVRFARRVITRVSQIEAEDHDCMEEAEFAAAESGGAFCLTWRAHGLSYGLPASVLAECREGHTVIANVSRRVLAPASRKFNDLHVVEVTAPRPLLVQRIAARGRETAEEIDARLARSVELEVPPGARGPYRIDNSGRAEDAAARFVELVRSLMARSRASV